MKKALHIADSKYINMSNIISFTIEENSLIIDSNEYSEWTIGTKQAVGSILVTIQEFKRIKRELETFMGVP